MSLQTKLSSFDSNLRWAKFDEGNRLQENTYLKKDCSSLRMEAAFAGCQVGAVFALALPVCKAARLGW